MKLINKIKEWYKLRKFQRLLNNLSGKQETILNKDIEIGIDFANGKDFTVIGNKMIKKLK